MERIFISINETCKALGVGRSTIYRMIGANELATVTIGRRRLVKIEAVNALRDGKGMIAGLQAR